MKQSRRVAHTKRALMDGLISLMKEKPLERITVKEICERADVNRSTFYVYYGSPIELLDSVKDAMYDEISALKRRFTDAREMLEHICGVVDKYRELMLLTMRTRDDMGLIRVFNIYRDDIIASLMESTGASEEKASRAFMFISIGSGAMLMVWMMEHPGRSTREIIDELLLLVTRGLSGYFE